jgi:hypothetical protein
MAAVSFWFSGPEEAPQTTGQNEDVNCLTPFLLISALLDKVVPLNPGIGIKSIFRRFIMAQLHKKFTDQQVKQILQRYLDKELDSKYIQQILGIGKTRFFNLLKQYKEDPDNFSIQYSRSKPARKISPAIEKKYTQRTRQ